MNLISALQPLLERGAGPIVLEVDVPERFSETIERPFELIEAVDGVDGGESKGRRVRAVGLSADVTNGNKRRYPRSVVERAVEDLQGHLHESAGQGRLVATGEAEHPSHKSGRPNLLETVIKWEAANLSDAGQVLLEGTILPTSRGRDILALVEHGVPIGVSMRGYGRQKTVKDGGESINEVSELTITGFDLVMEPSDPFARILESKQLEDDVSDEMQEVKDKAKAEGKAEAEKERGMLRQLDEAKQREIELQERLAKAEKAAAELEERKRLDAIDEAIAASTQDLPYGEKLNAQFVEAVRKAAPADAEAVKPLVESKRAEWDGIMAQKQLGRMGFEVKGPVFEEQTGQPEFARAAFELAESLRRTGLGGAANMAEPVTPGERYARQVISRFDELHKAELIAEARRLEEANLTSDLNLPYSVSRAIMAEAMPMLVSASVFDVGVTDQSPTRIYFETFAYESGATGTVTDEEVVATNGEWVALANARITFGSVVVTTDPAGTTYVEGDDYVIDYAQGRIMTLASGDISTNDALLVDYTYLAIRKGEMQPIERGKVTLAHKTMEIAADRLATQISKEAIVFSRSQLGYDIVGRNLSLLAAKVRQRVDGDIFYRALAAALTVANNSGGTWTSASDSLDDLVAKIGYARVKLSNRYYMPTGVLLSTTNADRLSNWDGFTAAGSRPDADLSAAGYVGRIKGMPVFESTEWPDTHILVANRQLVMHRVFQPMAVFGPYPTYDASTHELIAADQYYIEEFNGTDVPIDEKAAYVKVA